MTTLLRLIFVLALLDFTATDAERVRFSAEFQTGEQSWSRRASATGRHQNRMILRRTSPGETECTPGSDELAARIAALQCDPDFSRAIREIDCLLPSLLFTDFRNCGSDMNGTFCVQHDMVDPDPSDLAQDINRECFNPPSQNCTSDCREILKEFAKRFGCCGHSLVDDDRFIRVLTPQLWQDCGVERPEPCDNAPRGPPVPDVNISCTATCSFTQYNAIFCKYLARKAIDIYTECGDDENAQQIAQECGFSNSGMLCAGRSRSGFLVVLRNPSDELNNELVFQVYSKCIQVFSNGTCPSECHDTLQEIRNEYGCCFNNLNTTKFDFSIFENEDGLQSLVTGNDLWSSCGVETPGFCSLPSDLSVYDDIMHCSVCSVEEVTKDDEGRNSDNLKVIVGGALGVVIFLVAVSIPIIAFFCCYRKK